MRGAIERSGKDEIAVRAAALAYYGILSLFPMLLFLVFLGSQFLDSADSRLALNEGLEELIPAASDIVRQAVDHSVAARGSIGLIAGIGLLWSASTLFNALTVSLNVIWDASPRPFWKRRAIAAVSVLTIGLLFIASITFSALAAIPLSDQLTGLLGWVNFGVGLIASVLLFWLVYQGIPNKTVNPRGTLAGATLAAILWQFAKSAFALYISSGLTNYGAIYGSLASVIALILWAYISALILFLGAEFAAALQREFWT
jgi:membrane protein